jgi:hypothetical protein
MIFTQVLRNNLKLSCCTWLGTSLISGPVSKSSFFILLSCPTVLFGKIAAFRLLKKVGYLDSSSILSDAGG